MKQLTLELATPPKFTFDNIFSHEGIGEACKAVRFLCESAQKPFPPVFLIGASGTGKTHLLLAAVSVLEKRFLCHLPIISCSHDSDLGELEHLSKISDNADILPGVAIDDVDRLKAADFLTLWNVCNKITRQGSPFIMTATRTPEQIFKDDEHLKSRIMSGLIFHLTPPEDHVRLLIMDKIARDKSLKIPSEVYFYLITRKSRNLKELEHIIQKLDQASLQFKRRITIPFIKKLENEKLL